MRDTRLANRFQWLVDNRQALNLKCLLQVGDFMNWDTPDHMQYERASAGVEILDDARLPYIFTIGNHDTQATGGTPEKPGGSCAARQYPRQPARHDRLQPLLPAGTLPALGRRVRARQDRQCVAHVRGGWARLAGLEP